MNYWINFPYICKMRDRAYRRHIEDIFVLRRLRNIAIKRWRLYEDAHKMRHEMPALNDYIGTSYNFLFKNDTTRIYDTRYKYKYSPNRTGDTWFYNHRKSRLSDKKEFTKILKEYGIK